MSSPIEGDGWYKPQYTFTRFIADCAISVGFEAIKYPSVRLGERYNMVILDGTNEWRKLNITQITNAFRWQRHTITILEPQIYRVMWLLLISKRQSRNIFTTHASSAAKYGPTGISKWQRPLMIFALYGPCHILPHCLHSSSELLNYWNKR